VYIPRLRTNAWYGDAITPDIMQVQDELNMRVADIGEAINYNSHAIRYGKNLPRGFNSDNFPLGPQAMWDLGRSIGQGDGPEVGLMEIKNPVPEQALKYIDFLYNWARTGAFAPPIAFGEDDGGGQRSGRTLEIRMWPLLRATRRSRGYMASGLQRVIKIASKMWQQKKYENVSQFALERITEGTIVPDFWPILPKDEQAIVDRVVKLMETPVPILSLKTAATLLGYGPAEVDRVIDMITDPELKEFFVKKPAEGSKPKPPQD
jgi:hypothetical protein